jgi:uncharacterized membrane protein YkvA (DUF1232 family)
VARGARQGRDTQDRQAGPARRNRRIGLRRLLGWAALLPLASRAPLYGRLLWDLVRDERIPLARKSALAAAAGYLLVGRDLLPDDLPILGGIDDLVVIVLAVDLFLDGVPEAVLSERLDALGVDRGAFDADVARIRRFTPARFRRMIRRLPAAISLAGDTLARTGLGPKVRAWITKEGSIA